MFSGHNTFISEQLDKVAYDLSRSLEKRFQSLSPDGFNRRN